MFSKSADPLRNLTAVLTDAQEKREKLVKRFHEAESALVEVNRELREAATQGAEDKQLQRLEVRVAEARRRVETFRSSLADLDQTIGETEAQLNRERDIRAREEMARKIEQLGSELKTAADNARPALASLHNAVRNALPLIPEACSLDVYLTRMPSDLQMAVDFLLNESKARAAMARAAMAREADNKC